MAQIMTLFEQIKKVFNSTAKIIFSVTLSIVIIIGSAFFLTAPLHTLSLWRMERAVASSIQHPAETSLVERFSFLGSRYIDDAECTYAVGEIRSTNLSIQELLSRYENNTVSIFGFTRRMPVYVLIIDEETLTPIGEPTRDWIDDFVERFNTNEADIIYYLVYLYEPGRSDIGDYRCLEQGL